MGLGNLGAGEIVMILVLVLLLFGAKRLPEVGRSLGQGIREFKRATKEITADVDAESEPRVRPRPRDEVEPRSPAEPRAPVEPRESEKRG